MNMIIGEGAERGLDRRQQNLVLVRLLQEIEGAGFYGENGCLDISLPGDDDDGWNESNGPEPRLHLQSGHLDVQENAAAQKMRRLAQKGTRGRIGNGGESHRSQESLEREMDRHIVVDHMDRP